MSTDRESTRLVLEWLREPAHVDTERVLVRALDQVDRTRQRRAWWPARRNTSMNNTTRIALTAAAAVVAAFVGLRLLGPQTGPPGGIASASPTATPGATPQLVPGAGELAPGLWAFTTVTPMRIVFDIPAAGWQKNVAPDTIWTSDSDGRIGFATVSNLPADPCDFGAGLRSPPVGPTVDDLATALATIPGLDPVTPSDVTLGGYAGKFLELNLPAETGACGPDDLRLWNDSPLELQARHRFWILDVAGNRLVIGAVERANLPVVLRNELQQIIDSIRIEPT